MPGWKPFTKAALAAGCAVTFALPMGGVGQEAADAYCAAPAEAHLLDLINDFRAGRGLDPLTMSRPLGAAATAKSREMAREGYFRHVSPTGVDPRDLVTAHGYDFNTAIGENLAAGREDPSAAFAQWRDSPPHREIMLDPDFAAVGIARAYDPESVYDWYWTAEFGGVSADPARPCSAAATPAAPGATPVHLLCNGVRLPDGSFDLTCREPNAPPAGG